MSDDLTAPMEPVSDSPDAPTPPTAPGQVKVAAALLMVLGLVALLAAAGVAVLGFAFGGLADADGGSGDSLRIASGVILVIGVALGALHLTVGRAVLRRQGWARFTGVVIGLIGLAISVLALVSSTVVYLVLPVMAYSFVLWVLATRGAAFEPARQLG